MNSNHEQLSQLINERRNDLAELIVTRLFELQPELAKRYDRQGRTKCLEDTNYHLMYLVEAIASNNVELFTDYVRWAKVLLSGFNVPASDLARNLEIIQEVLVESMPENAQDTLERFISSGLSELSALPTSTISNINEQNSLSSLANHYLDALLQGNRHLASQMILDAVQAGTSVRDIYLQVFQPCQYEVGRLWQTNKITVAHEHYCTAATQMIMSQLYPYIFSTEKHGRWLVATSVAGELHEIGSRMVADFFEMEGWDTLYLGANTPAPAIVRAIIEKDADVLAISATMTFHVSRVTSLISLVRATEQCDKVKVIVGGYPFNIAPELWKKVGADGYGRDALEAIDIANHLTTGK